MDYAEFFQKARALADGHPTWDVYTNVIQSRYADNDLGTVVRFVIIVSDPATVKGADDVEVAHADAKEPDEAIRIATSQVRRFVLTAPAPEPHKCSECGQVMP
jgi:hypothetical protein